MKNLVRYNLLFYLLIALIFCYACKDNTQNPIFSNQKSIVGIWKLDSTIVNTAPFKVDTTLNYTLVIESYLKYKKISNINTIMQYGTLAINADSTVLEFIDSRKSKTSNIIKVFNESKLQLERTSDGYLFKEYFTKK